MGIEHFNRRYGGERIFLIGNGPSLADTPLEALNDEYTFAMNNIKEIYDKTDWRPSFYLYLDVDNVGGVTERGQVNLDLGIPCFFRPQRKNDVVGYDNAYVLPENKKLLSTDNEFANWSPDDVRSVSLDRLYDFWSTDLTENFYSYHSMYIAMQLAVYMGFKEIYFVGTDLYGKHSPHMIFNTEINPLDYVSQVSYLKDSYRNKALIRSIINGLVYKLITSSIGPKFKSVLPESENLNYFTNSYNIRPADQSHRNEEHIKGHIAGRRIATDQGCEMYNASLGGKLEVHPRVNLSKVIDR